MLVANLVSLLSILSLLQKGGRIVERLRKKWFPDGSCFYNQANSSERFREFDLTQNPQKDSSF